MSQWDKVFNFSSLEHKKVLITGASAGIGLETAILLSHFVSELHLVARRGDKLENLLASLKTEKAKVFIHAGDVTQKGFLLELKANGVFNCDIVVNNAGGALGFDFICDAEESDWDTMIQVNMQAAFRVIKYALPWMIERKSGHIINLTSVASHTSYAKGSVYCATKHAMLAFARSLRSETCEHQIRVTNISPGLVETEFSLVRFHGDSEKAREVYRGLTPLSGKDISRQILFCLLQPPHVNVDEIYITPVAQGEVTKIIRVESS